MKCKFCREEIPDGVKFCPMCGSVVQGEEPESQGMTGVYEGNQTEQSNQTISYGNGQVNGNSGYQYGMYGQQTVPNGQMMQQPINGTLYMVLSVLALLLCCLPLGIVSIVYSSKINSQQKSGDYEGARQSAKMAKIFLIISMVFGIIVGLLTIGLAVSDFGGINEEVSNIYADIPVQDEDSTDQGEDGMDGDLEIFSDNEIVAAPQVSELGDNWDSYTVQINDHAIALPCEYKELEELGLVLNKDFGLSNEDGTVSGRGYSFGYLSNEEGNTIMVDFINPDSEKKNAEDCLVGGISVYDYDLEDGKLKIAFPGNIQIGATKEEVIGKYGETADDAYEGEDLHIYSWYDNDMYFSSVEACFDAESGKLTQMSMRNYGE